MKIAICINTSWNIYNFRRGLVDHFLNRGDEVVAIAPRDDFSDQLIALGCEFEHVPMSASGLNPVRDLSIILKLHKILKHHKPDVFLSYTIKPNIYGSLVCGNLKIPAICNVSGLGTVFLGSALIRKVGTTLYSAAFRYNKWVFFQNSDDQSEFLKYVRLDASKSSVLPGSGMNTEKFVPGADPQNEIPVFLMLSRLLIDKGVREFADAARRFKTAGGKGKFILVGGHDEGHSRAIPKEELQSWIDNNVLEYTSHVSDVKPFIEQSDVVVLPSYREGTPRTLLEAGSMGKPLIATDVPGCNNVVEHGYNGLLCRVKDSEDLAKSFLEFEKMTSDERKKMGNNARSYVVEKFDEGIILKMYDDKINDLTSHISIRSN